MVEYRALLVEYRALLVEYRDLLKGCKALWIGYRAFMMKIELVWPQIAVLVIARSLHFVDIYGSFGTI